MIHGGELPAKVREWYATPGPRAWRDNLVTPADRLGEPADFLENGLVVLETDSQHCCRWVIRLRTTLNQDPLFGPPEIPDQDPPVWIADPDDPAAPLARYSDTFTDYVRTSVWDDRVWRAGTAEFDRPLRPNALRDLRNEFTELPSTYSWAVNQECDVLVRFTGAAADVAIAIEGDTALFAFVRTEDAALAQRLFRTI